MTCAARSVTGTAWNIGRPGGRALIGPTLRIDLDIQAVRQQPETP
jgi:hypothetical protein